MSISLTIEERVKLRGRVNGLIARVRRDCASRLIEDAATIGRIEEDRVYTYLFNKLVGVSARLRQVKHKLRECQVALNAKKDHMSPEQVDILLGAERLKSRFMGLDEGMFMTGGDTLYEALEALRVKTFGIHNVIDVPLQQQVEKALKEWRGEA